MAADDLAGRAAAALGQLPLTLCGFMGVGKSSVGRRLSELLDRRFSDVDQLIVGRLGRSIPELFVAGEEPLFRATEALMTKEAIAERPAGIVALGGGALEDPSTRKLVTCDAALIYLHQTWEEIAAALPTLRRGRPLLTDRTDEEIHQLYVRRTSHYEEADLTVAVGRTGVQDAVEAVLRALASLDKDARGLRSDRGASHQPDGAHE